MIRIAITDDHPLVIEGISSFLNQEEDMSVVASFENGKETIEGLGTCSADLLLLDINLPDISGIDVCKKITTQFPKIQILCLSSFKQTGLIKSMIKAGAKGYVIKNADKKTLLEAIKTVSNSEEYIQKELKEALLNEALQKPSSKSFIPQLTRREKEVLKLIIDEYTTHQIAEKLFISPKTVETHRLNLLLKLDVKNTAGLVKIALEKNLV